VVYGVALIVAVPLAWTAGRQLIALFIDGVVVVSIGLEAVMHVRGDQGRWSLTIPGGAVRRKGRTGHPKVGYRWSLVRRAYHGSQYDDEEQEADHDHESRQQRPSITAEAATTPPQHDLILPEGSSRRR
jgi:hypothetical protein